MRRRRPFIVGLMVLVLALLGGLVYNMTFHPKHREIAKEAPAFQLGADELHYLFANDEATAVPKYMDQVLQVSGTVTEMEETNIVLDQRVLVNFLPGAVSDFQDGQTIVIKGRCVGFDELLLQVKIDQATLIK